MKLYIHGLITGGVFVFTFFVFIGQTNIKLTKEDENWYKTKGWVQALFDLEINLSNRIEAVSRLLLLEVNDLETDIEKLNKRLNKLEGK